MADPETPDRDDPVRAVTDPKASPDPSPAPEPQPERRALIAGVAGLVAGALAKATPAEAQSASPMFVDQANLAFGSTRLLRPSSASGSPPVFFSEAGFGGPGIAALSRVGGAPVTITAFSLNTGVLGVGLGTPGAVVASGSNSSLLQSGLATARGIDAGSVFVSTDPDQSGLFSLVKPMAAFTPVTATAAPIAVNAQVALMAPQDGSPLPPAFGTQALVEVLNLPAEPGTDSKTIGLQGRVRLTPEGAEPFDGPVGVRGGVEFQGADPGAILMFDSIGVQGVVGLTPALVSVTATAHIGVQGAAGFSASEVAGGRALLGGFVGLQGIAGVAPFDPSSVTVTAAPSVGVQGFALDPDGYAGMFVNLQGGTAMKVHGDVEVEGNLRVTGSGGGGGETISVHCGSGTIRAGRTFHDVIDASVRPGSYIAVQFTTNPGTGKVSFIDSQVGIFRIHLKPAAPRATSFQYIVIDC
jgi:hypothetical protein